jgi:hypothetical protein
LFYFKQPEAGRGYYTVTGNRSGAAEIMTRALHAAFALSAFPHENMNLCKGAQLPTRAMLHDDPMEN